jgi:hypothetical protein
MRRHRRHISLSLSLSVPLGCSSLAASSRRASRLRCSPSWGWAGCALARACVGVRVLAPSGWRGANQLSRSATSSGRQGPRSRAGRRNVRILRRLGRLSCDPWRAVKGAKTGPSPVWFPERHGPVIPCGLVAFEQVPARAPTRAGCRLGRRGLSHARPRRSLICGSGWRGASRSRTQEAKCALHTSDRGRRDA